MGKKKGPRRDAVLVDIPNDLNALFPYLMKRRCDSTVYFSEDIDVENILKYIGEQRRAGRAITFFHVFLIALTKILRERVQLNRFMKGRKLWQRENVVLNFIAKRELSDEGSETNVTVRIKPEDDFDAILAKIKGEVKNAKAGGDKEDEKEISKLMRLPRWVLMLLIKIFDFMDFYKGIPKDLERVDPIRCSAFVANLGSVGIEAPYHHLYEWGTNSLFIAIGRIKKMPFVEEDGTITVKTMVNVKVTLDERISDGYYCARSIDLFKQYLQNPWGLEAL